jgi:hypothetical protein
MTISLDRFFRENGKRIWCSTDNQELPDYDEFEEILEDRREKQSKKNMNDVEKEE